MNDVGTQIELIILIVAVCIFFVRMEMTLHKLLDVLLDIRKDHGTLLKILISVKDRQIEMSTKLDEHINDSRIHGSKS